MRTIGWAKPKPLWAGPHAARPHAHASADEGLECPMDVCALDGHLYVVDAHRHRIAVFSLETGEFVRAMGRNGAAPGEFKSRRYRSANVFF